MASPPIRIETIDLRHQKVPPQLLKLFYAAEAEHPQFGLDWLSNLVRHAIEPEHSPKLLVAWGSDNNVCALPLLFQKGGRITALTNFYTSLYQPICTLPDTQGLLRTLFCHLRDMPGVAALTLSPMDPSSKIFEALNKALLEAGWRGRHDYFCFGNWRHELHGSSWDNYLGSRPSRVRNTVKRKTRSFVQNDRGTLQLIGCGEALERAITDYNTIYANSWKRDEPFPEFIPNLVRMAAKKGWLRFGIAYYDGKPVASQIWLVSRKTAYIYKLAYDENYAKQSPGTVLTAYMMRHVINDDEVHSIDYLSGDDAYKRDWMSARREIKGITAFNPASAGGLTAIAVHLTKQWLKTWRR